MVEPLVKIVARESGKVLEIGDRTYYSVSKAAELVGVSSSTMLKWVKQNRANSKRLGIEDTPIQAWTHPFKGQDYIPQETVDELGKKLIPVSVEGISKGDSTQSPTYLQ